MRPFTNHSEVAHTRSMPFDGLGLPMESVHAAAWEMSPIFAGHAEDIGLDLPAPEGFPGQGGYKLLVALGREIRGR